VGGLGVLSGEQGQPRHSVTMDPGQSRGLTDSQPFTEMFQDLQDLRVGELAVEERRPLELGEPGATNVAVEESMIVLAVGSADREVAGIALTVTLAIGILAAERSEVVGAVHDVVESWS